jgi:hypothetical protein
VKFIKFREIVKKEKILIHALERAAATASATEASATTSLLAVGSTN